MPIIYVQKFTMKKKVIINDYCLLFYDQNGKKKPRTIKYKMTRYIHIEIIKILFYSFG